MNCRSAEDLFSSFLEEELSQKERRVLESHLTECRRCTDAVEELRATVELVSSLPTYETSPHFEDEILDRIRSGEALRPTLVEWLSEWLAPARLKPVFLAGATASAVWIALLLVHPTLQPASTIANRDSAPAATTASPNTGVSNPSPAPVLPAGSETIASAPQTAPSLAPPAPQATKPATGRATGAGGDLASRPSSPSDSAASATSAPYQDEYILDQFYLNRSSDDGVHSIVPVTGRASDDVYIVF
jgi:anti-sigma factor RsiW